MDAARTVAVTLMAAAALFGGVPAHGDRPVVALDLYHRKPPMLAIGANVVTGEYGRAVGHYRWDDWYHPNGFATLRAVLEPEFSCTTIAQRPTSQSLTGVDVLVVANPDLPDWAAPFKPLSEADVEAIAAFVRAGGSLVMLGNALDKSAHGDLETFDRDGLNSLAKPFGLRFNEDSTGAVQVAIPPDGDTFNRPMRLYYDNGCSLELIKAPGARCKPLIEYKGKALAALSRFGEGNALAIGDCGSWGNGLMSLPGYDNAEVARCLFALLKSGKDVTSALPTPPLQLEGAYEVAVTWTIATVRGYKLNAELLAALNPKASVERFAHYYIQHEDWKVRAKIVLGPADPKGGRAVAIIPSPPRTRPGMQVPARPLLAVRIGTEGDVRLDKSLPPARTLPCHWRMLVPALLPDLCLGGAGETRSLPLLPLEMRREPMLLRAACKRWPNASDRIAGTLRADIAGTSLSDFVQRRNLRLAEGLAVAGGNEILHWQTQFDPDARVVKASRTNVTCNLWVDSGADMPSYVNISLVLYLKQIQ